MRGLQSLGCLVLGGFVTVSACETQTSDAQESLPVAEIELVELSEGPLRIEVREGGAPWAVVHLEGAPFPYVYPVLAPGGSAVTRGFPMDPQPGEEPDHPHHRSLWFAHGSVNGGDFWHAREGEQIEHEEILARSSGGEGVLRTRNRWLQASGKAILTEQRTWRFASSRSLASGDPASNEPPAWRTIDVHVELTALEEAVTFGDTKEGSWALRVHPQLRAAGPVAQGVLRNEHGDQGREAWGKPARWIHATGDVSGARVGVALFDHPSNPRHPTWWHARTYGLLAANPFGQHDFEGTPEGSGDLTLAPGEVLRLRYRALLHSGELTDAQIEQAYRRFVDRYGED